MSEDPSTAVGQSGTDHHYIAVAARSGVLESLHVELGDLEGRLECLVSLAPSVGLVKVVS
jgi:hypothetical protein